MTDSVSISHGFYHWNIFGRLYTNVCKYNFAIDKKTNILNILSEEIGPSIKKAQVYYYKELDCTKVDWSFDYNRVVKNVETLTVMVYQSFTTDITGRSLVE